VQFIGVVVGAIAGYYRGWVDAVLMRLTDIVIVIPIIVIGAVVGFRGRRAGPGGSRHLPRLLRVDVDRTARALGVPVTREREFVEAARVAGASDLRIIFKHILPNAIGVVIVSTTLLIAVAIILETSPVVPSGTASGPPEVSLGLLISGNESAFQTRPLAVLVARGCSSSSCRCW
jgi:peptide/nickel transport system permease protein